jgi:hypothetical protein
MTPTIGYLITRQTPTAELNLGTDSVVPNGYVSTETKTLIRKTKCVRMF